MSILINASFQVFSTEQQVELSIKPLACIVKKAGESCKITINAHWRSDQPIDVCLFQEERSLSCWKKQTIASQHFNIDISKDMIFSLKSDLGKTLAEKKVHVNTTIPKHYRRRLKAEWSLF